MSWLTDFTRVIVFLAGLQTKTLSCALLNRIIEKHADGLLESTVIVSKIVIVVLHANHHERRWLLLLVTRIRMLDQSRKLHGLLRRIVLLRFNDVAGTAAGRPSFLAYSGVQIFVLVSTNHRFN